MIPGRDVIGALNEYPCPVKKSPNVSPVARRFSRGIILPASNLTPLFNKGCKLTVGKPCKNFGAFVASKLLNKVPPPNSSSVVALSASFRRIIFWNKLPSERVIFRLKLALSGRLTPGGRTISAAALVIFTSFNFFLSPTKSAKTLGRPNAVCKPQKDVETLANCLNFC